MTAPAGVEMATRTGPLPGQSLQAGNAAGAARSWLGAAMPSSNSADSGTGTFRSGLQSLLASMATEPANLGTLDAETEATPAVQNPPTAGTEGKAGSPSLSSDYRAACPLPLTEETAQEIDSLAGRTVSSMSNPQAGFRSTQPSSRTERQATHAEVSGRSGIRQGKVATLPQAGEATGKPKTARHGAESTEVPASAAAAVAVAPPMAVYTLNPPSAERSSAAAGVISAIGERVPGQVQASHLDAAAGPAGAMAGNTSNKMDRPIVEANVGVMSAAANPDAIKTSPLVANAGPAGAIAENISNKMDRPIVEANVGVMSAASNPDAIKTSPLVADAGMARAMAENASNNMDRPIVDANVGVIGAAANPDAFKTSPLVASAGPARGRAENTSEKIQRPIVDANDGVMDAAANPDAIKTSPLVASAGPARAIAGYTSDNIERPAIDANDRVIGPSGNHVSGGIETALRNAIDGRQGATGDRAPTKDSAPAFAQASTGIEEHRDAPASIEAPAEGRGGDVSLPVTRTASTEPARNEVGTSETRTAVPELNYKQTGESALKDGPNSSLFISPSTNRVIRPSTGSVIGASLPRAEKSGPGMTKIGSPDEEPDAPMRTLSTTESPDRLFEPIHGYTPPQRVETVTLHPSGGALSDSTAGISATTAKTSRHMAQPSIATKSAPGSGEHDASESAAHSALNPVETLPHANRLSEAPQGTAAQHGLDVAQTTSSTTSPVGLHGQISLAEKPAGVSSTLAAPASREPFAAIDEGFVQARPTWIHAGANHAEAGYQDSTLGWVGVRAEVSGGGIHAALVPGSADAAQALSGHMTGLNAYLTDHQAGVEKLTLAAPHEQSSLSGLGQGSNQNMQQGTGQNSGQGSGPDHWMNQTDPTPTSLAAGVEARTSETVLDVNPYALGTEGVHISVLA